MKRFIFTALHLISCICLVAQTTKTYTITFDREDFILSQEHNVTSIQSKKYHLHYIHNDSTKPAIPFVTIRFLLPENRQMKDYTYTVTYSSQTNEGIILENSPQINTTDQLVTIDTLQDVLYTLQDYPADLKFLGENSFGGYRYVSFKISPFSYDAVGKKINWVKNVDILLNLTTANFEMDCSDSKMQKKQILSMVNNPEEAYNITKSANRMSNIYGNDTSISYLIITTDSLKDAFQPLANWKTTKGVKTSIVTIEDINREYSNQTLQLKIKQCIKDFYNNGLQYVLLGGDETIVPIQGCYASIWATTVFGYQNIVYNDVPTDLFYASLNPKGSFDWNADGDSLIGEISDNVSYESSIAIGRASVSKNEHVKIFVDKVIGYEFNPSLTGNHNKFLLSGTQKSDTKNGQSDAEVESELMFEGYVRPNWSNVIKHRFFDTASDFTGYPKMHNYINMIRHLSNGYHHLHVNSHGYNQTWSMNVGGSFHTSHAYPIINDTPTIIATTACLTNSFDKPDSCLAESFMHGPQNGVIAYLGASREGLSSGWNILGPSASYNAFFYENLFKNNGTLGESVAYAKNQNIEACNEYSGERWIQYGLNLLGDPELNLYTDSIHFSEKDEDYFLTISQEQIRISSLVKDFVCTLTSKQDYGYSFFQSTEFNDSCINNDTIYYCYDFSIPESISIKDLRLCLIKRNHLPLIIDDIEGTYIQNEIYTNNRTITGKNIYIGSNVTRSKAEGPVIIENGSTTFDATNTVTIKNDFECKKGAILEIK